VIRMFRRDMRLYLVAALGIGVAMPSLAATSAITQQATQTSLAVDARDLNGQTQATLSIAVMGGDGQPAAGTIAVKDHGKPLAGFALDAKGRATATMVLAPGDHSLSAVYIGDQAHLGSRSEGAPVRAVAGTTPDFSVSIAPATLSLKQGQSGSAVVSVTPINAASLAGPMFVTISCSSLPDQSKCTFTPENIEIPIGATAPINSSLVLSTQAGSLAKAEPVVRRESRAIAWAVLLPGSLILGGFAFGARRRRFLSRMVLLGLVAFVTVLGTAACSPLYNYYNHGPPQNLPTPAGTFTVGIAAQSSNGVTATTHTTTIGLTVTQ
jgi:Bacterial Ig-like domain (group 3)